MLQLNGLFRLGALGAFGGYSKTQPHQFTGAAATVLNQFFQPLLEFLIVHFPCYSFYHSNTIGIIQTLYMRDACSAVKSGAFGTYGRRFRQKDFGQNVDKDGGRKEVRRKKIGQGFG
jgi:hypothetical protein